MEDEVKFNMSTIEQTLAEYQKNKIYDGVVIALREDGAVFNIGGKSDAFISKDDFEDFSKVKIGDRFKALVLGTKTEDGMIEVSATLAKEMISGMIKSDTLRVGSTFSFIVNSVDNNGLYSKLGEYKIVVPIDQIDIKTHNTASYKSKQLEGIVLEKDDASKLIIVSVKLLKEQVKQNAENIFWNAAFLGKKVVGKVVKIMPYGAFVDINGIDAFIHISDISYKRLNSPEEVLSVGKEYEFRIIKLDKENNKVSVGLKQNTQDPKVKAIKELKFSEVYEGTVTKLLPFGAIIELDNGASGLLHINDATDKNDKRIYEIVKQSDRVVVGVKSISDDNKVSFRLLQQKSL